MGGGLGGGGGGSDVMNTIISAKIIATFMCLPSENAHQCCQMAGFCSVVKRFKLNLKKKMFIQIGIGECVQVN